MKVFAYGSNMNLNRIRARVPSAVKIQNAILEGYNLTCSKKSTDGSSKATIFLSDDVNANVWGVIYEIDEAQKKDLDKAEGLGNGYSEIFLEFIDENNDPLIASAYIADINFIDDELLPYDWYMSYIVSGERYNELPNEYIERIDLISSMADQDINRRNKNINILNGSLLQS